MGDPGREPGLQTAEDRSALRSWFLPLAWRFSTCLLGKSPESLRHRIVISKAGMLTCPVRMRFWCLSKEDSALSALRRGGAWAEIHRQSSVSSRDGVKIALPSGLWILQEGFLLAQSAWEQKEPLTVMGTTREIGQAPLFPEKLCPRHPLNPGRRKQV